MSTFAPNFFCTVEAVNELLKADSTEANVCCTFWVDLIDMPYMFYYSENEDQTDFRAYKRHDIYVRDIENMTAEGSVAVKKDGTPAEASVNIEIRDNFQVFFNACRALKTYVSENIPEDMYKDIDPEEGGVVIKMTDGKLTSKTVKGKERPFLMCAEFQLFSFFGGGSSSLKRPYNEDLADRNLVGMMSLDMKIAAAEGGSLAAANQLAELYENGDDDLDIAPDEEKAVYYQRKAAELGDPTAMYNMAVHYIQGTGVDEDKMEAYKWAKMALDNFESDAAKIVEMLENDIVLKQKAEEGDPEAMTKLAKKLMEQQEFEDSFKYAQRAYEINSDDSELCYILALAYSNGRGVETDDNKAAEFYQRGADLGNASCVNNLASYYMEGKGGIKQDAQKGMELLKKAVEMGNTMALGSIAYAYETGQGVEQNLGEAIKWYERFINECDNGMLTMRKAARVSGLKEDWRMEIEGMPLDKITGLAENGDSIAISVLISFYENGGENIAPDPEKVLYWSEKAAEAGDSEICMKFAEKYLAERDFEKAMHWLEKASDNGDSEADDLMESLEPIIEALPEAESGDLDAMETIVENYFELEREEFDDELLKWAFKAAEKGGAKSALILGTRLIKDELTPDVHSKVTGYLLNIVDKADEDEYEDAASTARTILISCYFNGRGVEKNIVRGMELMEEVADNGNTDMMKTVAKAYRCGLNEDESIRDKDKAIKWYERYLEEEYDFELEEKLRIYKETGEWEEDDEDEDDDRNESNIKAFARRLFDKIDRKGELRELMLTDKDKTFDELCEEGYIKFDEESGGGAFDLFTMDDDDEDEDFFDTDDEEDEDEEEYDEDGEDESDDEQAEQEEPLTHCVLSFSFEKNQNLLEGIVKEIEVEATCPYEMAVLNGFKVRSMEIITKAEELLDGRKTKEYDGYLKFERCNIFESFDATTEASVTFRAEDDINGKPFCNMTGYYGIIKAVIGKLVSDDKDGEFRKLLTLSGNDNAAGLDAAALWEKKYIRWGNSEVPDDDVIMRYVTFEFSTWYSQLTEQGRVSLTVQIHCFEGDATTEAEEHTRLLRKFIKNSLNGFAVRNFGKISLEDEDSWAETNCIKLEFTRYRKPPVPITGLERELYEYIVRNGFDDLDTLLEAFPDENKETIKAALSELCQKEILEDDNDEDDEVDDDELSYSLSWSLGNHGSAEFEEYGEDDGSEESSKKN